MKKMIFAISIICSFSTFASEYRKCEIAESVRQSFLSDAASVLDDQIFGLDMRGPMIEDKYTLVGVNEEGEKVTIKSTKVTQFSIKNEKNFQKYVERRDRKINTLKDLMKEVCI